MTFRLPLQVSLLCVLAVALPAAVRPAAAQRQRGPAMPSVPGGTVTGHVYAADTQRPVRFATVQLIRVPAPGESDEGSRFGIMGVGRTALDGSFYISNVPPGDYYAAARVPGYVSPLVRPNPDLATLGLPQVHVEASRSANVEVSVQRGAAITGHITYDDGTPAAGVAVNLRDASDGADALQPRLLPGDGSTARFAQTDDRGVYRLAGVAPGRYWVSSTVVTADSRPAEFLRPSYNGSRGETLAVFAPHALHRRDARVIEIRGAEELADVDITLALAGLHSVRGALRARDDRHALSAGSVALTDATDPGFVRRVQVAADGSFAFNFIPPGTYKLTANGSDGVTGRANRDTARSYENVEITATVGEHDAGLDDFLLPPSTPPGTAARIR